MSVYDKELVINGKAVRSPEQQVYQNMKDIKALQEVIKPEYNTTAELTEASVSVALSTTNAPSGTTEGWIITQDGLKFKITGGDETNLLLEFYSDLKGPQGEQGPQGPAGPSAETSGCYLLENANQMTNLYAYTYEGQLRDIDNQNNFPLKIGDTLIGDNGKAYKLMTIDEESGTFTCIDFFTIGKVTYQHNIHFESYLSPTYTWNDLVVFNNDPTPFTAETLLNYLYEKGYIKNVNNVAYSCKKYPLYTGGYYNSNNYNEAPISALAVEEGSPNGFYAIILTSSSRAYSISVSSITSFTDDVE